MIFCVFAGTLRLCAKLASIRARFFSEHGFAQRRKTPQRRQDLFSRSFSKISHKLTKIILSCSRLVVNA